MKILQMFILALLETTSTLILWNAINMKSKNSVQKNIAVVIVLSIIIVITNDMNIYVSMTINYLGLMALIKITFHKKIIAVLYEFCIIAVISIIIQLIYTIPVMLIFSALSEKYYFDQGFIITILTLVTSIVTYRYVPLNNFLVKFSYKINKAYILLLNILIYILMLKSLWEYHKDLVANNIVLFISIPILLIAINIVYFRYTIRITEQRKTIEMYDKYSPIMFNLIEEVRRRQHDHKNHMNTIYGISEVSSNEDIRGNIQNYITSLNNSLKKIDKLVVIDHHILAALIYSKSCEAEKYNINISYDVILQDQDFIVGDYELTEIISNLIDNAFEAVIGNKPKEREVEISISNKPELFKIEVKNKGELISPQIISKIFNKGFTTKGEKGHGYGLYNIKKIVEFHNGEIQLSNDNGYNIFRIYFNKLSGISGSPHSQSDAE